MTDIGPMREEPLTCNFCGKEIEIGISCDDPECAKKAADAIAEMNAGIPTGNPEEENGGR